MVSNIVKRSHLKRESLCPRAIRSCQQDEEHREESGCGMKAAGHYVVHCRICSIILVCHIVFIVD